MTDASAADPFGLESLDLDWLRSKAGSKWYRAGGPDGGGYAAWVADMDFPPAPVVVDALTALARSGDFGYRRWPYSEPSPLPPLFVQRMESRFGWSPAIDELVEFNDVVHGLLTVLERCTRPGSPIAVHTPAYSPFLHSIRDLGRDAVPIPARRGERGWSFDHGDLAVRLRAAGAESLILCHPHNPTGHVFTLDELQVIGEVATELDLLVISDEIHAELVMPGHSHVPAATVEGLADRTVTLTSASKAFNLAGLRWAIAHVGSARVRETLSAVAPHALGAANMFGAAATEAAWTGGDAWLQSVLALLDRNRHDLEGLVQTHLPGVDYVMPDATYLAWLDCRALGLGDNPADAFARVGVHLSPGPDFGEEGTGFVRLNFATSPSVLAAAVRQMAAALR